MKTLLGAMIVAVALAIALPVVAQTPDLGPWDGVWLKTKIKQKGFAFHLAAPGVGKDNGGTKGFLQLHADALMPDRLMADVWIDEGGWQKVTVPLLYLAGTPDDVALYLNQVPVTPDPVTVPMLHLAFVIRLRAKIASGVVAKGSAKSLGGYFIEVDDQPGSNERFAGSVSLRGKTTTKLPPDLPAD